MNVYPCRRHHEKVLSPFWFPGNRAVEMSLLRKFKSLPQCGHKPPASQVELIHNIGVNGHKKHVYKVRPYQEVPQGPHISREGYLYWAMARKCDKLIAEIRANPPGLKGWLNGGIDRERMLKLKEEIEGRI